MNLSLNNAITVTSFKKFDQSLISDETLSVFVSVVDTWLSFIVSSIGIIANIVTIIVFVRMGFKETVNITLTIIAFWDMIRVLCGTIHRFYGPMSLVSESLGKSWQNITIPNIVYLQNIASNVAYVIGSYVALERCLCISVPFRVKTLVTPKVTLSTCLTLSVIVFWTLFPSMLLLEFEFYQLDPNKEPMAVYQFTLFYKVHGKTYLEYYKYFNLLYPTISLTIMLVSTVVILYHLRKASGLRKGMTAYPSSSSQYMDSMNGSRLTRRDGQVVKMLLVVIASYMLVLVPRVVNYIVELFEHEYFLLQYYNNIFLVVIYTAFLLDFINSALGLAIFYSMSSKFRTYTKITFLCPTQTTRDNVI